MVLRPLATVIVAALLSAGAPPAPVHYTPPTDAPVIDGFRPPATPYGPGNRGLEYAASPGSPVRAAAAGTVVFAGAVAGTLHVTVAHADGIRTSYSFLATVAVHEGESVAAGELLGISSPRLFFSARLADAYLDPAVLLAGGVASVRLVPETVPAPPAPDERHALQSLAAAELELDPAGWQAAVAWARRAASAGPIGDGSRAGAAVAPVADWWSRRHHCTPARAAVDAPGDGHVAVLVGGLGSSSTSAAIDDLDTGALGYDPAAVVRFSYAGGQGAYTPADTLGDIAAAGRRLVDLLDAVVAAAPGQPVDLLAHSQGGLVARVALSVLAGRPRTDPTRAALATVVTFGTPYQGADPAAIVAALDASPAGRRALDIIKATTGTALTPSAPAIAELAPHSAFLDALARAPRPGEVPIVSIAARGDVVVPAGRSRLPGATNVVVSVGGWSDHDRLPGAPEAQREAALALGGFPPACTSVGDAIADGVGPAAIGVAEDVVGTGASVAGWLVSVFG